MQLACQFPISSSWGLYGTDSDALEVSLASTEWIVTHSKCRWSQADESKPRDSGHMLVYFKGSCRYLKMGVQDCYLLIDMLNLETVLRRLTREDVHDCESSSLMETSDSVIVKHPVRPTYAV